MEALTLEEIQQLFDKTEPTSPLGIYIRLGYYTGLRVSEVLSLTVGDVAEFDKDKNIIIKKTLYCNPSRLKGGKSLVKSVKSRTLLLNDNVRTWLATVLGGAAGPTTAVETAAAETPVAEPTAVDEDEAKGIDPEVTGLSDVAEPAGTSTITKKPIKKTQKLITIGKRRIQQLIKELFNSIPTTQGRRLSTHSLRKSYAIHAYNLSDKNLSLVQHLLGHKSISSTGVYLAAQIYPVKEVQTQLQSGVN